MKGALSEDDHFDICIIVKEKNLRKEARSSKILGKGTIHFLTKKKDKFVE
jgi:hypothetical protein